MNRWVRDVKGWRQSLIPGEAILAQQDGIRLDDGESKTSFSNGEMFLTTHRIAWTTRGRDGDITLSLSLVVLAEEEQNGFMKSEKIVLHLAAPPLSKTESLFEISTDKLFLSDPSGPSVAPSSNYDFVRIAFKNGGMKSFVLKINEALSQRKWMQTVFESVFLYDHCH